jgi:hypothetical protein
VAQGLGVDVDPTLGVVRDRQRALLEEVGRALRWVAASDASLADKLVVILVAFLITMLPATLPLTIRIVAPGPSITLLARLNTFTARHQRRIVIVVEVAFGIYLLVRGIRSV